MEHSKGASEMGDVRHSFDRRMQLELHGLSYGLERLHVASFTREYPECAAWWEAAEARVGAMEGSKGRPADNAQFSKRYSRAAFR
jgi:hypothetical protein